MTAAEKIRSCIEGLPPGQPFSTTAFVHLGTRANLDQALSRLVKAGELQRVGRGILARPKPSRFSGVVLPTPAAVVEAVACAAGAKWEVHGAEAARRLGLSTQVPARTIFWTTGTSRHLVVGRMPVEMKHVSARKLALVGRPAGIGLVALYYLGRHGVTAETVAKIAAALGPEEFAALRGARSTMPAWMADALYRYE